MADYLDQKAASFAERDTTSGLVATEGR